MGIDAKKIRARRLAMGITQAEAAQRAGMKRENYCRVEGGRRINAKVETAQRIAKALEIQLQDILDH